MTSRTVPLPAVLDLAGALVWIANHHGRYLPRTEALDFIRDLPRSGSEAHLIRSMLRFRDLDPGDVREETILVLGREQKVLVSGGEADRHWAAAWESVRDAARRSAIVVHGRPQGRSDASLVAIPASDFGQIEPMQDDDDRSRLAFRAARDRFWDCIEILTADVLRTWPIENMGDAAPPSTPSAVHVPRRRGPKPRLRLAVEQAMRDAARDGLDLQNEKEDVLAERFGASRATCRDARNNILPEINSDKLRQTKNTDK